MLSSIVVCMYSKGVYIFVSVVCGDSKRMYMLLLRNSWLDVEEVPV